MNSMQELPTIATERLVLRPFTLSDAADVQRLAGDWAVADTTLSIPHPYPDGAAERWIERPCRALRAPRDHGAGGDAARQRRAGRLHQPGLHDDDDRAELGYWMGVPYWNHGYCSEAARALVAYGFEQMGLHRIYAHHFTRNPASGRVMQKAGMTYEGTLRQHIKKW